MPDIFLLIPIVLITAIGIVSFFMDEEDLVGVQLVAFLLMLFMPMVGLIYSSM
jgi:hypothetical protein